MKNTNETEIKRLLAEHLGVDSEDIHNDDSLSDDLHMGATDLTDFGEMLQSNNVDTSNLDFTEIETVLDLLEALGVTEENYS